MLIINGKLITWGKANQILTDDWGLLVRDGIIEKIAPQSDLIKAYPDEEQLDAEGQYIMPGNICAHTHFYGAFSRGLGIPGDAPRTFTEILDKLWWNLDKALDPDGVRYSALVFLVDAIRHGTTTLIDHHASPNAIENSLDIIADAVNQSGLRASLCYEVTDRDGPEKAEAGIQENLRFIHRIKEKKAPSDGNLRAHFGLHASLTLSDETLARVAELCPEGIGFHIHAAEGKADQADSLEKSGKRVLHRLDQFGILRPQTILAHGVHLDQGEIERLAERGSWLTHQPRSNMNNAVGVAPIEQMLDAGVRVGMGNDGFSNTMWQEWKAAYLLHKSAHRDPRRMGGYTVRKIAVENNGALITGIFDGLPVGEISEGAAADLIFVDYSPFTPINADNLPWHILFGFQESMVTATIVAGKPLMYRRELLTLDEKEIMANALAISEKTWEHFQIIANEK
ncbi:MAG: putative aminohydrolase SsnA [Brevefilum sp.]|nr:putative aminohydrolase SsnA [Brevefilum sp.]